MNVKTFASYFPVHLGTFWEPSLRVTRKLSVKVPTPQSTGEYNANVFTFIYAPNVKKWFFLMQLSWRPALSASSFYKKITKKQLPVPTWETDNYKGSRKFSLGTFLLWCRIFGFRKGSPKGSPRSQKFPETWFLFSTSSTFSDHFGGFRRNSKRKPKPCCSLHRITACRS